MITSRGDHNSYQKKLIDSINDTFFNNDPLGNLSLLDNNEGRISWHISKKLEGLIFLNEMYNKKVIDINRNIDIEKLVKKYINNILKSHNISNNYSGWATTKYSRNKDTKLYLSVDNASIFYPLLLGVNSKLGLSTFKKKKILKYFDIFFNNHEVNFNKKKKIYEISDINYKYNGIEPLNWQAMFGLCLLEAYKFSGRDKYLIRLNQITSSIVDQIILQDNQIIWPYHFRDKDFQINNYEDVSHAAITVNFLIEMKKFDEINAQNFKYISSNTANLLSNTLDNMVKNNSFNFPRFIKSNKTNSYSYKYLPDWYWVKLNNKKINQFLSLGLNIKNNNLHNSNLFEYIVVLNKSLQSFTN